MDRSSSGVSVTAPVPADTTVSVIGIVIVPSRKTARQAIVHGHFHLGGRRLDRPGYLVQQGDKIAVSPREKSQKFVRDQFGPDGARSPVGSWIEVDLNKLEAVVSALPARDDVMIPVEEHLIVEFCSR